MLPFLLLLLPSVILSQDLDRKITLRLNKATPEAALKELEKKADIHVSYAPAILPKEYKVTYKAENKPVREVLKEVLDPMDLTWLIVEGQVVLKKKQEPGTDAADSLQNVPRHPVTLSGVIREQSTGEVLIGANVFIRGTNYGATSNGYGFYSLTIPSGRYPVSFTFLGFQSQVEELDLDSDKQADIGMTEASVEMQEVEIVSGPEGSDIADPGLSDIRMTSRTLSRMPGFAGDVDVIKSLQIIPGFNSFGDGSAFFYTRGGNSDQNLYMIDEAPVYNPSHLFGFFSAISPDAINEVEAYKGDFPARYGGRLSSVIDIKAREGNLKRFGFSGNIGPYASNLSLEGPIVRDKGSFFVSGRISTLDWLKWFDNQASGYTIYFYDINAKLNYQVGKKDRLFGTFYMGHDNFSGFQTTALVTNGISWENILGTLRWNHLFNPKLFSNTTATASRYNYFLFTSRELNEYWYSSVANITLKTDFTWFLNPRNTLKGGAEATYHYSNPGNINASSDPQGMPIPSVGVYHSLEYVMYLSNEQHVGNRITLRYGIRLPVWQDIGPTTRYVFNSSYNVIDTLQVGRLANYYTNFSPEPRLSIQYSLNTRSSLKAAYSRNTQFMQVLSNSNTPFTSLEVWAPADLNIRPQISDQVSLGYFTRILRDRFQVSAEAYYKHFKNHLDYKDHANLLYNPLLEGQLRFGSAWAYGLELMIRKPAGKFTGWIGYTFSRTFIHTNEVNNGKTYPASYDRPNDLCINLAYSPTPRWTLAANWILMTGGAITTPIGFYYSNGYSVPVYDDKNNDRLPTYHRLDLSATYKLSAPGKRFQQSLGITLYNAYGRLNPYTVSFNKFMDDQGDFVVPANLDGSYKLVPTTISVAGIIPSVNYQFKF
jgi:hypothetical protein